MSLKYWFSLRRRAQSQGVEEIEAVRERRQIPWKWPRLASTRESYDLLCEECDWQQQSRSRRCRHQVKEKSQAGYTNPME